MSFGEEIITWYNKNKRDLPWRRVSDPYKVWLSEVLLQQTRVDQGTSYYLKFVENFPTVWDLASATEEQVLNLWQGLGYYSRARNLHFAAQQIIKEFNGVFPNSYKTILTLKGVGDYTASAIASICFDEEVAVVDGNVYRVLSRYLAIDTPIDTTEGKKLFKKLASDFIKGHNPSEFNQGMMELGALVCTPKKPNCENCPLSNSCESFAKQTMLDFPIKAKKTKQQRKFFNFLVINNEKEEYYFEKREGKGIWQNMYQFPLIETPKELGELSRTGLTVNKVSLPVKHVLSHQIIFAKFWECSIQTKEFNPESNWELFSVEQLEEKPLPRLIENYIPKLVKS